MNILRFKMGVKAYHLQEKEPTTELLDGIHYTGNKGPCFGTRHTQVLLMSLGNGIAIATKTAFSIIIIAMTTANTSSNSNIPVYDWDNKGALIGSIMWSGIPVYIVGGYLAKLWGPKWITLGMSIVNAVFFMLIPLFAQFGGAAGVIFCRVIQGVMQGGLSPIALALNGIWVPAEERSIAGLIGASGSIGIIMLFSLVTGVIAASPLGWPWCFYIGGIIELVWCVTWFFLAHQNPQSHPRITPEERQYIEVSLSQQRKEVIPTPCLEIITSIPCWAIIVAGIGTDWLGTMLSTAMTIFMTKVLEMDVQSNGTIMAIAPLVGIAVGMIVAPLSDFIIKKNILRCVNARRLFHGLGAAGGAIVIIWISFISPGNKGLIILNLSILQAFILMYSVGGANVNALDVSPVFAGVISGVASTFSQSFAIFAPLSVDWIIHDETSAAEWKTIFLMTAGIVVATAIFFVIFATDKRQEQWEVKTNSKIEYKGENII